MKYKLLILLVFSCSLARAVQPGDPGLPGDDPDLPIDGGLTVLLVAGAAYGLRKINQLRRA